MYFSFFCVQSLKRESFVHQEEILFSSKENIQYNSIDIMAMNCRLDIVSSISKENIQYDSIDMMVIYFRLRYSFIILI